MNKDKDFYNLLDSLCEAPDSQIDKSIVDRLSKVKGEIKEIMVNIKK